MIKKLAILSILFLFAGPVELPAGSDHGPALRPLGSGPPIYPLSREMRTRLKMPVRLPVDPLPPVKPVHPIVPGHKPDRPGNGYPRHGWTGSTSVVREVQPIVIVNAPPPEPISPPPQPRMVWVPPLMETRTQPGYWDHGIKKVWMGDHWRFEQDFKEKTWVPESEVRVVRQAGYWKPVEPVVR